MRIPQSYVQKCKVVAHLLQAFLIFIAACITIGALTKDGDNSGASKWYFALCFLSVPALVYLTMVPMWSKAARFANVWAFIAIDALYTIFWFSAFIAVQVYNSNGINEGEEKASAHKDQPKGKNLDPPTGCDAFAFGEPAKCSLNRACVGFGVVIFLLFVLTTAISLFAIKQFRKDGTLIYMGTFGDAQHRPLDGHGAEDGHRLDPQKDVWSAETGDLDNAGGYGPPARTASSHYGEEHGDHSDEEPYDSPYDTHLHEGAAAGQEPYTPLHATQTEQGTHPGRPVVDWESDTSYGGAHQAGQRPAFGVRPPDDRDDEPSALSPGGYDSYAGAGAGGLYRDDGYGYERRWH